MIKIGIIGPALSGKTTLFQLLTGTAAASGGKCGIQQASARIPDIRVEELSSIFKPRKTTLATVEVADFPALGKGFEVRGGIAGRIKTCEALAMVIRAHRSPVVPWPDLPVTPDVAFSSFLNEMVLSDLCQIETIISKNKDKKRTADESSVLEACQALMEETHPISAGSWREEEYCVLRNYAFLSSRPVLVAVNLDEEQLMEGDYQGRQALLNLCADAGYPLIEFCGTLEAEISQMGREEQSEFFREYGLKESGIARLAGAAYRLLNLCSFFTVGEDEVRAWTITAGTPARKAAGKVHSDIERGFIRAEVISCEELVTLGGSLKNAREQGKLRLEGKDYPVRDGDIINFRFNV